ncbi:hypothetical protein ACVWZL_008589 [Bradyrhizobium sp. GM2.4]
MAKWAFRLNSSSRLPRPTEQIDHCAVESRDVVRLSAGHQTLIGYRFLIHPLRSGVSKVDLERRPRCHAPAARCIGIDDGPWTVTSPQQVCRRRRSFSQTRPPLGCIRKESGLMTPPGSSNASKSAKPAWSRFASTDSSSPQSVKFQPRTRPVFGEMRLVWAPASSVERLPRLDQFDVLEAVGGKNSDLIVLK